MNRLISILTATCVAGYAQEKSTALWAHVDFVEVQPGKPADYHKALKDNLIPKLRERIGSGDEYAFGNYTRTADLREANVKYLQTAARKAIEKGFEKEDSQSARRTIPAPLSESLPGTEYAELREKSRGATATTRVEIYQVGRTRGPKP